MAGNAYHVVKGDNLWKIAKKELGAGAQWPRLWRYNNRREVIAVTGRGIPNPDLILVGQRLLIPRLPGAPAASGHDAGMDSLPVAVDPGAQQPTAQQPTAQQPTAQQPTAQPVRSAPAPQTGLSGKLPATQSPIAFKFRLEDLRWPPVDAGTAIIETRMTGDILFMTKKAYPVTYVTSRGELEHQVTREANTSLGKLISDNRYVVDPANKNVTFRSMLVSQSNNPGFVATAIGVEVSSNSPLPKLRAEFRLPKLEGSIDVFRYSAVDVKVVVEITPKPPRGPSPQPIRVTNPAPRTAPATSGTDWGKVIGVGLMITGGAIITATLVEDFLTAGAGVADDPASFAAASAALARGALFLRGAVVPVAAAAAVLPAGGKVILRGSPH
jgi:hypothetical protein